MLDRVAFGFRAIGGDMRSAAALSGSAVAGADAFAFIWTPDLTPVASCLAFSDEAAGLAITRPAGLFPFAFFAGDAAGECGLATDAIAFDFAADTVAFDFATDAVAFDFAADAVAFDFAADAVGLVGDFGEGLGA